MKIGLVVPGFSADEHDWCIPALLDYVRVLARRAEVHVFTLRYPHYRERYSVYGAEVHPFGAAEARGFGTVRLWAAALATLAAEHRRGPFDLLHAFWADEPGLLVAIAARLLGVRSLVSVSGGELARLPEIRYGGQLRRSERWKTRLALWLADRVTGGSVFLVDRIRAQLTAERQTKVCWAPLGVDLALFPFRPAPSRSGENRLRLVNVASLLPVKDHALLFDALRRLRVGGSPVTLTLVGDGPLGDELRRRAAADLEGAVTFVPAVRRERLAPILHAADLFVLSSRHEAECLAVLEAAACGLPVVGTAVGVVPELAPDVAISVPPGDPVALAQGISALADDRTRIAMSWAARERVERDFSLEPCVDRFWRLYTSAASDAVEVGSTQEPAPDP
jgi:glycosyltransferase involved in cell wall biosynthesis